MRDVPTDLADDLAEGVTTLARLFTVELTDGTELRFTDADIPVTVGADVFRADVSFSCSAISLSMASLAQQNLTIAAIMSDDGFKEADLRAKRFNAAFVTVDVVNYAEPDHGTARLFTGTIGPVRMAAGMVVFDIGADALEQFPTIAYETYQATCRASLFDGRCGLAKTSFDFAFTVDTYANRALVMTAPSAQVGDYYKFGFIEWTSGPNEGLVSKVVASNGTTGITLSESPPIPFAPGDTGILYPGCDKIVSTCRDKFSNVVNFRGEPDVPNGQDVNFNRTAVGVVSTRGGGNTLGR